MSFLRSSIYLPTAHACANISSFVLEDRKKVVVEGEQQDEMNLKNDNVYG